MFYIKCMNITSTLNLDYNQTFSARSQIVRTADNIARKTNLLYPSISSSNIKSRAKGNEKFKNLIKKIADILGKNVRCFSNQIDALARAMLIASSVKQYKVANCAELSRIANLISKVNGIDTIPFQFSVKKNDRIFELDHMALLYPLKDLPHDTENFNFHQDIIVIDPWLGFADYAPKAQERYNKDFRDLLKISVNDELLITPQYISTTDRLCDNDIKLLKDKFPAWFNKFLIKSITSVCFFEINLFLVIISNLPYSRHIGH